MVNSFTTFWIALHVLKTLILSVNERPVALSISVALSNRKA